MTVRDQLDKLQFCDSNIETVNVFFSPKPSCILNIDYYDWEESGKALGLIPKETGKIYSVKSTWKRLTIKFDLLEHVECSLPDLIDGGNIRCITGADLDHELERFKKKDAAETISIKFNTFPNGYIWLAGSGVSLEWDGEDK